MLHVQLSSIPAEGKLIEGKIDGDIFQLGENALIPVPPVIYRLNLTVHGDLLLLQGDVECTFKMTCVRCLEQFLMAIRFENHAMQVEIEDEDTIDLTEVIREDTLLALPGYPRCDESGSEGRVCPKDGEFVSEREFEPLPDEPVEPTHDNAWEALDDLKQVPKNVD